MPRNAVVSGGELVGAARDADLWDFCGARRRPSRAHTVSPFRDFGLWLRGMFHGPACVPGRWQPGRLGCRGRPDLGSSWLGPPAGPLEQAGASPGRPRCSPENDGVRADPVSVSPGDLGGSPGAARWWPVRCAGGGVRCRS